LHVSVDVSDARPEQLIASNQLKDFLGMSHGGPRQIAKVIDHHAEIGNVSECQLAKDKGMEKNVAPAEKVTKSDIRVAKMIDPDRRISQE
jgi:hypothetical protein